jgi:excisionase family DNA binding protein
MEPLRIIPEGDTGPPDVVAVIVPLPEQAPTLTVNEARVFYRLSRSLMYDGIRAGEIPSIRIGRRVLVPTAAMRRHLGLDPQ